MGGRRRRRTPVRRAVRIGRAEPGTPPGTLTVDPSAPKPVLRLLAYGPDRLVERVLEGPAEIRDYVGHWPVTWVSVEGLGDAEVIEQLGAIFGLHRLALEDVVNTHQRPKLEEYGERLFIVARIPAPGGAFHTEQLSLFLGPGFVLTFEERSGGGCFEAVRRRIREGPRTRLVDVGYLAYELIDVIVDRYFPVLESFGERLEQIEEEIAERPTLEALTRVRDVKHELLTLRRSIWPLQDVLSSLLRDPLPSISDVARTYFRDCYDHTARIIDLVEMYRELGIGLGEFYQSTVGQRMNEIMKVLTVMATIFIPLSFIAGIYGMNFNTKVSPYNLPELNWYYGYPFALLLMALVAAAMIVYFRRRGWIGG